MPSKPCRFDDQDFPGADGQFAAIDLEFDFCALSAMIPGRAVLNRVY